MFQASGSATEVHRTAPIGRADPAGPDAGPGAVVARCRAIGEDEACGRTPRLRHVHERLRGRAGAFARRRLVEPNEMVVRPEELPQARELRRDALLVATRGARGTLGDDDAQGPPCGGSFEHGAGGRQCEEHGRREGDEELDVEGAAPRGTNLRLGVQEEKRGHLDGDGTAVAAVPPPHERHGDEQGERPRMRERHGTSSTMRRRSASSEVEGAKGR